MSSSFRFGRVAEERLHRGTAGSPVGLAIRGFEHGPIAAVASRTRAERSSITLVVRGKGMSMTERQRSYSWEDPTELAGAGMQMPGLDYLRAMLNGDLPHPPICATIGFRFVEFEEGRAVMELEPGEHQYNPIGTVHGSVIVALLDSVAGSAVHTTLPAGVGYTTVSLNTSFLRPVQADTGTLRAEGRRLRAGRRAALAEADLVDADGSLYGHATSNCMILGR